MLSPDYLKRIAEGSENIASSLHSYILNRIIEAIMNPLGTRGKVHTHIIRPLAHPDTTGCRVSVAGYHAGDSPIHKATARRGSRRNGRSRSKGYSLR